MNPLPGNAHAFRAACDKAMGAPMRDPLFAAAIRNSRREIIPFSPHVTIIPFCLPCQLGFRTEEEVWWRTLKLKKIRLKSAAWQLDIMFSARRVSPDLCALCGGQGRILGASCALFLIAALFCFTGIRQRQETSLEFFGIHA
jgi:hypothetical protein